MTKQDPWFFEERAYAFAKLVLTKRQDVIVRAQAGGDMAVDLLVEVLKKGKSTLRFFGVQIVAFLDLPDGQTADRRVLSRIPGDHLEAEFPICAVAIGVRKPEGVYRWVVEPTVEDGRALLHRDAAADWRTLDETGTARLIAQVNAYYDALNGVPPQKRAASTRS
jgi:hypothetical protein